MSTKIPSRASIRRALTTLKRADVIKEGNVSLYPESGDANIFMTVNMDLLSPKKSLRKRTLKVKKVETSNYISPSTDGY